MNSNKKWYKRIDVCFWFVLTGLPFIFMLVLFIGFCFSGNHITTDTDLLSYFNSFLSSFSSDYSSIVSFFDTLSMDFLNDMFSDLFNLLSVNNYLLLGSIFGYMLSITFYHLLFDFIAWLPKIFGKWLHKFDD